MIPISRIMPTFMCRSKKQTQKAYKRIHFMYINLDLGLQNENHFRSLLWIFLGSHVANKIYWINSPLTLSGPRFFQYRKDGGGGGYSKFDQNVKTKIFILEYLPKVASEMNFTHPFYTILIPNTICEIFIFLLFVPMGSLKSKNIFNDI